MLLIVVPDASLSDVYPCGGGMRRGGRRGERAGGRGRGSLGEGECAPRVFFLYQRAARPPRRVLWSLTTTRGGGRAQRGVASGGARLGLAGAKGWGREADLSVVSTGVREKKKCGPTRARCAPPAPIFSSLPLSTPRPFTKIAHATGTTPRPSSPPSSTPRRARASHTPAMPPPRRKVRRTTGRRRGRPGQREGRSNLSLSRQQGLTSPLPLSPSSSQAPALLLAAAALLAAAPAAWAARPSPAVVDGWMGSQLVRGRRGE